MWYRCVCSVPCCSIHSILLFPHYACSCHGWWKLHPPPYQQPYLLFWLIYKQIWLCCDMRVCVYMHVHWVPGRVAWRLIVSWTRLPKSWSGAVAQYFDTVPLGPYQDLGKNPRLRDVYCHNNTSYLVEPQAHDVSNGISAILFRYTNVEANACFYILH